MHDHSAPLLHWLSELQSKTIRNIRPSHTAGPVPEVIVMFTDGTSYLISIKDGVYFKGCLINTLRRAQPVVDVVIEEDSNGFYILEIRSRTFPLLQLQAVNKNLPAEEFPFQLTVWEEPHA